jgi:hypothetical protein
MDPRIREPSHLREGKDGLGVRPTAILRRARRRCAGGLSEAVVHFDGVLVAVPDRGTIKELAKRVRGGDNATDLLRHISRRNTLKIFVEAVERMGLCVRNARAV